MTSELPLVDFAVVDELRESVGGDKAFVADLASTYLSEGDDHIKQIADALGRGDIAGMPPLVAGDPLERGCANRILLDRRQTVVEDDRVTL